MIMVRNANRRLRALERKAPATSQAEFDRLMLLASSGQLGQADLSNLSDEQLWWLVAQEPVAGDQRLSPCCNPFYGSTG